MVGEVLHVSFDTSNDEDLSGVCVMRPKGNSYEITSMRLGKDAEKLYKILTDQNVKFELR